MNISIICVGKLKEKYLIQGIEEYAKRMKPYAKLNIIEVADEQAPEKISEAEAEQIKEKEGERIVSKISNQAFVIALAIDGQMLTSEQLAAKLEDLSTYGQSNFAFVIGGSLGLSKQVLQRANYKLSFSKMTFPHQLMRLILIEQIYRAFKINRGEPYHK